MQNIESLTSDDHIRDKNCHKERPTCVNFTDSNSPTSKPVISQIENATYDYPFASSNKEIVHLNLDIFKAFPCPSPQDHNRIQCQFYHCPKKDRKRPQHQYMYCSFLCPATKKGEICPNGENCSGCHNNVELNYHPNNYKKRFCIYFPDNIKECKFGRFCSYAHSENDILVELIHNFELDADFFMFHYKTSFCPVNHIDHDRSQCVYAHNWQDYRRKPNDYQVKVEVCPEWNHNKIILNYTEGCSQGYECQYCHGWKEPEYHPFVYKTKPCDFLETDCPRGISCSYYHNEKEKKYHYYYL